LNCEDPIVMLSGPLIIRVHKSGRIEGMNHQSDHT
jgi:hypothetical protein